MADHGDYYLAQAFLRVTEAATIDSVRTMGRGDSHGSDQLAFKAMRRIMDEVDFR
jgi:fructose-1,6-bisphosphatase/sedoheptulose 1,7-bisphosphatase-like protein